MSPGDVCVQPDCSLIAWFTIRGVHWLGENLMIRVEIGACSKALAVCVTLQIHDIPFPFFLSHQVRCDKSPWASHCLQ